MLADTLVSEFRDEISFYTRCSPKVAQQSAHHVALFLRRQEEDFPHSFTYPHVMAWLRYLANTPPRRRSKAKREPSTVNGHLKSLKRFARWAVTRGYLESNPVESIRGLTENDRIILAPDAETVARVLAVASTHGDSDELRARNRALVCAMVDIGPRAGELVKMDAGDLYPDIFTLDRVAVSKGEVPAHVILHRKRNKDGMAAVNTLVLLALMDYLPLRRARTGVNALWVTETGERMTYEAIRGVLSRICRNAGVWVGTHDLRRFCHTVLHANGIDQVSGMQLGGWSKPETYLKYIRGSVWTRALNEHRNRSALATLV